MMADARSWECSAGVSGFRIMVTNRSRLVAALVACALLLAACGNSTGGGGSAQVGDANGPPAFAASTLAGGKVDSASFAGQPTVLWFWAPWCTICRAEGPDVAAAAAAFADQVDLIGVAGRGEVPAMNEFVVSTGTNGITHVIDDDGSIWSDYGVAAQPAFAFIGADGKVDVHVGALGGREIEKRMQALASA